MDFQSAARFGERRVMVTDYDETAVEVNAKVVDEDTGEVICECESGGGGTAITTATMKVAADSDTIPDIRILMLMPGEGASGYFATPNMSLAATDQTTVYLINGEFNIILPANYDVTVTEGDSKVITTEQGDYLHITGDCTIKGTSR